MKYQFPLVIFDPNCPLCLRFKQGLEIMNRNIQFESLESDELFQTIKALNREDCEKEVHLLINENEFLKGREVVDYLLESTPMVSKLSWLLDNEAGDKVKDFFYKKVEELREIVHEKKNCPTCRNSSRSLIE